MAKTASSKTKLEREKEKAEKARQKAEAAAEKEKLKQQKDAEKAQAAAAKAAKAADRARVEAEREKLRREKEEVRLEREKLQIEREKDRMAREKEKSEREKEKSGKEKAKKEKAQVQERVEDRSRNLLSAFLGVTQKPATIDSQPTAATAAAPTTPTPAASAAADISDGPSATLSSSAGSLSSSSSASSSTVTASQPSLSQPLFHPFQLKPNSSLAPLHRLPPANIDEISYMTQQHSPSSTSTHYPSLVPTTPAPTSAPIHSTYMRVVHRRKRLRSVFYTRPSRRNKLIQHHRTFRPPFYGYLPTLPAQPLTARRPFVLQSTGLNYDVDSDEEWGEEPEGEELGEDEDEDEEGDGAKEMSRGQLRRDGYEEDGDFTVPEDEDEALLMGGLVSEARVVEKGGKKRVVIRPIVVGPWHAGEAIPTELAELRRRTQWKWCRPLTRDVVKRTKELDEDREKVETGKADRRKADGAAAETLPADSNNKECVVVEERRVSTSEAQPLPDGQQKQQQAGDCFAPPVKKKVKRTIVPQLTLPAVAPQDTAAALPLSLAPTSHSQQLPPSSESKRLDAVASAVDVVCVVSASVAVVSDVAMDLTDAEASHCVGNSELESELELTTELSCSETGTCSDMLTSELSTVD